MTDISSVPNVFWCFLCDGFEYAHILLTCLGSLPSLEGGHGYVRSRCRCQWKCFVFYSLELIGIVVCFKMVSSES